MKQSSMHIKPVKPGSERHNNREQKLNYVRTDLSHLNDKFSITSITEARKFAEENCKAKTGRTMQKSATPIREGVLLIGEEHGIQDLKNLAIRLEKRFGIKTIQAYTHKDEGHYDKITKEWKPNYHAHMVFDWTDHKTGKSIKLNENDMSEMQTIVAEQLGMERGVKSTKIHIESKTYKAMKLEEDLNKLYNVQNVLPRAVEVINQAKGLQKEIEPLKTAKNSLELEIKNLKAIAEQEKLISDELAKTQTEFEKRSRELKHKLMMIKIASEGAYFETVFDNVNQKNKIVVFNKSHEPLANFIDNEDTRKSLTSELKLLNSKSAYQANMSHEFSKKHIEKINKFR